MKIRTHIGFGFFFGSLLYFLNIPGFGIGSIFLSGLTAYLPDIDWLTRYLGLTNHRTYGHNIWFLIIVSTIIGLIFGNLTIFLITAVGILSHLISDSITVTGVWWLWPIGSKNNKYHISGPINMSDPYERKIENIMASVLFGLSGFFLFGKGANIQFFSIEGLFAFGIIAFSGFIVMKYLDKFFVEMIHGFEEPIKELKKKKEK